MNERRRRPVACSGLKNRFAFRPRIVSKYNIIYYKVNAMRVSRCTAYNITAIGIIHDDRRHRRRFDDCV